MRRTATDVTACVFGDIHLLRPLGLAGVRAAVVARPDDPIRHSRFARVLIPRRDADAPADDVVDALLAFAAGQTAPPALFMQQDAQLLLISRQRERLARGFRFLLPPAGLVEDLVDKARFQGLAQRLDLPVPATRRLDLSGPPDAAGLRFPIILKPLTRTAGWGVLGAGGKALRVGTAADLKALWPRLATAGQELLAQELIDGDETRIESYHVYVDPDGRIAGEFAGRKLRTWPRAYGFSTAVTLTDAADVLRLGRELSLRIGLRGVAKFDFKRGPDGRLHLLEVNPRFNLWHHLGAVGGVNLPALVHADLTGRPRPTVRPVKVGACWCNIGRDRLAARAAGLGTAAWLRFALGCEATAFALDDPMPSLRNRLFRNPLRNARPASPPQRVKG